MQINTPIEQPSDEKKNAELTLVKDNSSYNLYSICKSVLTGRANLSDLYYRRALKKIRLKQWDQAEICINHAINKRSTIAEYYNKLAVIFYHQSKRQQEAEALTAAIKLDGRQASWHYRQGQAFIDMKKWPDAAKSFNNAIERDNTVAEYYDQLAIIFLHQGKRKQEAEALTAAIELDACHAIWHYRLGQALVAMKKWTEAADAFRNAIEHDNTVAEYFNKLAGVLRKGGQWWQEVEALEAAIAMDARHATWHYRLGEARDAMNRFDLACEAYETAIKLKNNEYIWYFRLGYALERAGQLRKSQVAYNEAIILDSTKLSQQFGIGVFHQDRGHWIPAMTKYSEQVKIDPFNAELFYRLGLSCDRCYEWKNAAEAYMSAISLNMSNVYWHFRLAFVFERMGEWSKAAEAYSYAVNGNDKPTRYWFYRWGYVLELAGRHKEACHAFMETQVQITLDSKPKKIASESLVEEVSPYKEYLNYFSERKHLISAISSDPTHPDRYYELGNDYERTEDWKKAAQAYGNALARKDEHTPLWYYRLGYVLTMAERYKEACNAFKETRILKKPYGTPEQLYNKSMGFKQVADYTEYYESLPVRDKVVLYESFHGASMSCNPYAIFRHLLTRDEFFDWTHVWVINDKSKVPASYKNMSNVIFVTRGSDLYIRHLANASFLINNVSFPEYFIRKKNQTYLNTWHGTPLKFLGKDIKDDFLAHKNVARNFLQTTHIISPNPHTTDILLNRYDVADIYKGIVAETGYPRTDMTLNKSSDEKNDIKRQLGIFDDDKVVLYAPTWRGVHGDATFDTDRLIEDINALRNTGCHILFRGHHMIENLIADLSIGNCVVPAEIDTNDLLSVVDVLVTDYSSIAFDFMVTGKPIIYYVYDLERYQNERGLYFPINEMPGEICHTRDELIVADELSLCMKGEISSYTDAQRRFCPHEDGLVAQKVVDLVFLGKQSSIKIKETTSRKSLLFFGGPLMPNGILSSFLNLISHIDPNEYTITIVLDPNQVSNFPDRIEQFERLPESVQVIGRVGRMNFTIEEKWINDKFNAQNKLASTNMSDVLIKGYRREFLRIFGNTHFDSIVQFEGYSRFWLSIFACAPKTSTTRKICYLHNNMYGEWNLRFPYLEAHFLIYSLFDSLISVSKQTSALNKKMISERFNVPAKLFEYCDNMQNPRQIISLSNESIDYSDDSLFSETGTTFINIGRLSVEKDQSKLIRAFTSIKMEYPESKLLILGMGPLKSSLIHLIKELGLDQHVHLLGQRLNPFPFLKKADCFVLSSNHEGQPMVLFEAMILGKSIVSTDIVGSRSVLENHHYGHLVDNSEDGLVDGMMKVIEEGSVNKEFDYQQYQNNALEMFYKRVV